MIVTRVELHVAVAAATATTTATPKTRKQHHRVIGVFCLLFFFGTVGTADCFVFSQPPRSSSPRNARNHRPIRPRKSYCPVFRGRSTERNSNANGNDDDDSPTTTTEDVGDGVPLLLPLMKLASAHCASQALHTAVRLGIPDIMYERRRGLHCCSIDELCEAVAAAGGSVGRDTTFSCNRDALLRTMRLLTTIDIVREETTTPGPMPPSDGESDNNNNNNNNNNTAGDTFGFSLTELGASLRSTTTANDGTGTPSMASCVLHWMEAPLWDSWFGLPDYIREGGSSALPFERANGGISSDYWYNQRDHPESLRHANDFVRLIHDQEIRAVAGGGFDWSFCRGKRLVDVGGHNGLLAAAIAKREPTIDCYCLDLPEVIAGVREAPEGVTMVPGNVFEPATIPPCDVILMKHFCDRCMWTEPETVDLLVSCRSALLCDRESGTVHNDDDDDDDDEHKNNNNNNNNNCGRIIIADAVLPDCGRVDKTNELSLYLDAMYMLVGRERQRTRLEWERLASAADLDLVGIESTSVPSCSLIILETTRS